MEYTVLGKTGLKISRMGFGGIPIQRVDRETARTLTHRLLEAGVNYIDTARGYTVSEEYLGFGLEGIRGRFILATKSMARTRDEMAADIDRSLKNLRTDYIDLYQVHNPTMEQLAQVIAPGGALEALLEAKSAGKIRHIGLTAHAMQVFESALDMDWVETFMFPYNIVENQGEDLIRRCAGKNIGFIAMKPLAGGAIEDASLALRYIRANPSVSVVIPGMAEEGELAQNLAAMNVNISSAFLFGGYLSRYGLADWAKVRYASMDKTASDCVGCGVCETRCPYHLPIREMLAKVAEHFGK